MRKSLEDAVLELIRRASSDLPKDVEDALKSSCDKEKKGSPAQGALNVILENVELARKNSTPLCQDTGTNIFTIWYGPGWDPLEIEKAVLAATRKASKKGYLRLNVVNSITGANTGDNVGIANPQLHFHPRKQKGLKMTLLLKGGGSENVCAQYKLPDGKLSAGRDLDGVRKTVIDAVFQAQGKGCAPGVIGVGIGGDRGTSYFTAKEQLLRPIGDRNKMPELAALEERLKKELNELDIGPMGFGGKTTVLDVLIGHAHRLPASYFVSVAYMCWACRRRTLEMKDSFEWKVR